MIDASILDQTAAIALTAQALDLSFAEGEVARVSNALVAQSLRRAVFISAPCSYRVARELVLKALGPLVDDVQPLETQVEAVLDDLVAMGDLLEMNVDETFEGDCVLRPAPPAFVKRRDETLVILGVAGDEITPSLHEEVVHHESGLRTVKPTDVSVCRSALLELGLIEIPERIWLHGPKPVPASAHVDSWLAKLPSIAKPEKLDGIEILDTALPASFYKGRWVSLNNRHMGVFVARRPQRYGAKLWSVVDVSDGIVQRFVDIHSKDSRVRACDEAWRLQAALDEIAGSPQKVTVTTTDSIATLSFSSPLPLWAERRLSIVGQRVTSHDALLAFDLQASHADEEIRWLSETLWLAHALRGKK